MIDGGMSYAEAKKSVPLNAKAKDWEIRCSRWEDEEYQVLY